MNNEAHTGATTDYDSSLIKVGDKILMMTGNFLEVTEIWEEVIWVGHIVSLMRHGYKATVIVA